MTSAISVKTCHPRVILKMLYKFAIFHYLLFFAVFHHYPSSYTSYHRWLTLVKYDIEKSSSMTRSLSSSSSFLFHCPKWQQVFLLFGSKWLINLYTGQGLPACGEGPWNHDVLSYWAERLLRNSTDGGRRSASFTATNTVWFSSFLYSSLPLEFFWHSAARLECPAPSFLLYSPSGCCNFCCPSFT